MHLSGATIKSGDFARYARPVSRRYFLLGSAGTAFAFANRRAFGLRRGGAWNGLVASFSTTFPSVQNPLASPWTNNSTSGFTKMQVGAAGKCYGTNVGSGFDDSYAYLPGLGLGNNYQATAVWGLAPGIPNDGISRELEFHGRVNSETSSSIKLYETDVQWNSTGVPFVRWDGAPGSFTIASNSFVLNTLPADNDTAVWVCNGNLFSLFQNSVSCGTINIATDPNISGTVYASGPPGIGAFIRPGAGNNQFYVKSYSVVAL